MGKEKNSSSDHQTGYALRNQNAFVVFFRFSSSSSSFLFFLQSKCDFSVSPSSGVEDNRDTHQSRWQANVTIGK